MRFTLASLIAVAMAFGLTAAPIPKGKVKDEDALVGLWQVEKLDFGPGAPAIPLDVTQMKFEFKAGGKMAMTMGEMPAKEGEYKLDPAAKVKTIDLTENDRLVPGIYELDGDTLKMCIAEGQNAARPAEMKPDGRNVAVVTLKRIKDEKKDK